MKHWHIEQVAWDRFDPSKIDPGIIPLVKAAAMVEKNGVDYAKYLNGVFVDDPTWNFDESFERYRNGYKIDINADASIRGSRTGELIARCMVEIGTSSYYTALGEQTEEPVLKEVCKLIAADEYRHFKLFYDHMKRYLAREKLSFLQRLRVAAGRVGESEDDELAFAFHCGNDAVGVPYDHNRCIAGYMSRAMGYYRYHHIERGMGMMFKTIGLPPRGRLSGIAAKGAWRLLCWRRDKFQRETGVANENAPRPQQAAA
jgi:hypothetical protein